MTRVVVLGALGHVGSALIRSSTLLAAADEIVLVDNLATQRYSSVFNLPEGVQYRFIEGDAVQLLPSLVDSDTSCVVQLAGASDPGAIAQNPALAVDNNLRITRTAVDVCGAARVPLIFPSSTSVYAVSGEQLSEDSPTSGLHPYSACKLEEERVITAAFAQGLTGSIYRFGTIVGISPGMRFHTAVNRFCWQAATGTPLTVWSSAADQVRPYLFLCDAVALVARTIGEQAWINTVANAASCNVSVQQVVDSIRRFIPDAAVDRVDSPVMNDLSFSVSTDRIQRIGASFTHDLDAQVGDTLQLLGGLWKTANAKGSSSV